eukprot:TRINITY_DN10714_c0_g1_i11.p1 TRINITY_DN10714_c0_g1~~TRINITY_DN10714_c0_g1_i11.p1  ORF type:complete len:874 (-),score=289.41 TRINITY_DN10714_c0_g1_i11:179-2485(-)
MAAENNNNNILQNNSQSPTAAKPTTGRQLPKEPPVTSPPPPNIPPGAASNNNPAESAIVAATTPSPTVKKSSVDSIDTIIVGNNSSAHINFTDKTLEITDNGSAFDSPVVSPTSLDTVDRSSLMGSTASSRKTSTDIMFIEQTYNNRKISSASMKSDVSVISNGISNGGSIVNGGGNINGKKEPLSPTSGNGGVDSYFTRQAMNNETAESFSKVNNHKSLKADGESKDEKITSLQSQLTDLQMDSTNEDEVRALKKGKKDLEMQLKDQEEELDDLAAQVQMLEASKTKLEMEMATIKKEHRREIVGKEEEIEEARASANKKVKILEQQLEQEHEERIMFLRERHDLEQKISTLQDMLERSGDEEQVAKLKKDLKKTKALLRDAQTLVEKNQNDGTNKVILRQLKNQLEDAEFARTAAMKARQNAEMELTDTQTQYDELSRSKQDLEDKYLRLSREKAEVSSQLTENEEELQEVMRKYKASVAAVSTDQITIQDQQTTIQELEDERNKLRDQVAELSSKLGNIEGDNVSTATHKRLELKVREFESKLELEITSKTRLETQIARLKEQIEKLSRDNDDLRLKEQSSAESQRKLSRQLRDVKEEFATLQVKETELSQKKFDLEKQLEVSEAETLTVKSDLKLAQKRIEDLSTALAGELDSAESEDNSDSSDEEMASFLEHHRRAMSVQRERESMARESVLRDSILRESVGRDSIARESIAREVRAGSLATGRAFASIDETKETISMDTSSNSVSSPPQANSTIQEVDESQA